MRSRRPAALALAAGLAITPVISAQGPPGGDLLEQARRMNQVAGQKVEADTRLALRDAEAMLSIDPAQAVEKLKQLLATVEADQQIGVERRQTLIRVVKDRIRVATTTADGAAIAADEAKAHAARQAEQKAAEEKRAAEAAQVKEALAAVVKLRSEGRIAEANKQARELLTAHPQNVAVQVLNGISTTADAIASATDVRKETEAGVVATIRDIERSAILPKSDIEFPKDWKEKTARRLKGQKLTEDEVRILQALNSTIRADYKNTKIQDLVDHVSTLTGRAIIIDKAALDELQLTYETPISFSPKAVLTVRNVLRSALGQVGLTYVVRDNIIQITSQTRARDMMVTKNYYVGDLVTATGLFGGAPQWGTALDQAQLAQNVAGVVEMVKASLDPMSWQGQGGSGTVGFNVPTASLIIRQSAEVHAMIRGGLYK